MEGRVREMRLVVAVRWCCVFVPVRDVFSRAIPRLVLELCLLRWPGGCSLEISARGRQQASIHSTH